VVPHRAGVPPAGFRQPWFERLEDRTVPASVHWTGRGDGTTWNDARNWDTLPADGDDVLISGYASVVRYSGSGLALHSLYCYPPLSFSGNLSLAAASENYGNLSVYGELDIQPGDSLRVDRGGYFQGAVSVAETGLLHLGGPSAQIQGDLDLDGTLELAGGNHLEANGSGTITGTVNVGLGASLHLASGAYTAQPGAAFLGAGQVVLGQGDGPGGGGGGADADLVVPAGTVEMKATFKLTPGGSIDGAGTLQITKELEWTGGKMKGSGITQINAGARMSMSGANAKSLEDRRIENWGTTDWTGGDFELSSPNTSGAVFTNYLTFNITGDLKMDGSGNAEFLLTVEQRT
jgi:hypothetical protein